MVEVIVERQKQEFEGVKETHTCMDKEVDMWLTNI